MISRSNIGKQITNGTANKKRDTMSRFQSTGDDAKDLEIIRSAKNIDDGPVGMKSGGKVKKK